MSKQARGPGQRFVAEAIAGETPVHSTEAIVSSDDPWRVMRVAPAFQGALLAHAWSSTQFPG
jgi:hypothetical protein